MRTPTPHQGTPLRRLMRPAMSVLLAVGLSTGLAACGSGNAKADTASQTASASPTSTRATTAAGTVSPDSGSALLSEDDLFTDRDLTQTADTTSATRITVTDGDDVTITEEGVYVLSGTATDCTVIVAADDSAKVQLVLDGLSITNDDAPALYVKSADKVFVTTVSDGNTFTVTGEFAADGDTNVDAAVFSKSDLVLNGTGSLTVASSANGITSKDDLKVTGGTYDITSTADALEANDLVAISDGTLKITSSKDGIHSENDDDDSLGHVYVCGGTLDITATDDGIQAKSIVQVDGGNLTISATECIEGTYVQVNGGTLDLTATDDGINAKADSSSYDVVIEFTGGDTTITMGPGDTDAVDSNGDIYVRGGTVTISANSSFDYEHQGSITGGTVTVNGQQITEMPAQMMPGGAGGGQQGSMPGGPGGGQHGDMSGGPGGNQQVGPR